MWKKMFVVLISFIGTISVVFALNQEMSAETTTKLQVGDTFTLGKMELISGTPKPVNWRVVDVQNNQALALAEGASMQNMYFDAYCSASANCDTMTFPNISATKNDVSTAMYGGNPAAYKDGIGFVADFDATISSLTSLSVTSSTSTSTTYILSSGFASSPFVITKEDYENVLDITKMYPANFSDGNTYWTRTNWRTGAYYIVQGTSVGPAGANSRGVYLRPAIKIDLSKVNVKAPDLTLTYEAKPQNSLVDYRYNENVKVGDKIGEAVYKDGDGDPTLSIIAHPTAPAGHENDYQNFVLTTNPTASPVDVKVKSGTSSIVNGSLKPGDYYFRVSGVDGNGAPNPAPTQDVVLTVAKSTPTLKFDDATELVMKIGADPLTGAISTSNIDTIANTDITYSLSGGANGLLTVAMNASNSFKI